MVFRRQYISKTIIKRAVKMGAKKETITIRRRASQAKNPGKVSSNRYTKRSFPLRSLELPICIYPYSFGRSVGVGIAVSCNIYGEKIQLFSKGENERKKRILKINFALF